MSASLPAVDRPTPTVAIVGTDAVLAAAPATPVQLAHACLRRGFTVAVPASWGDELVAAETLRRLATRDRGPSVMCVCPFVRARLLGPGADLAPFLVSLVPPPVAVARYLRWAYGEHGVHVTYIGACPGADDPSIDARLTPDAFIADLVERRIALSEQPLVFDSIVPPDRRRWCSLPGGVPNAEILASETDGRTVVEIERDDVTTELAQHIIAREHVLLDLAPSLGCACSGATGLVSPVRARAEVAAAEPPRALGPVIDPGPVVSLDVPVTPPAVRPLHALRSIASGGAPGETLERVLDELLGVGAAGATDQPTESDETIRQSAVIVDLPHLPPVPIEPVVGMTIPLLFSRDDSHADVERSATGDDVGAVVSSEALPMLRLLVESSPGAERPSALEASEPATVVEEQDVSVLGTPDVPVGDSSPAPTPIEPEGEPAAEMSVDHAGVEELPEPSDSPVRRRTPPAMLRYPGSSVPKATVANGRPLPRAYVAKRRTPPTGATVIAAITPSSAAPVAPPVPEPVSVAPPAADAGTSLSERTADRPADVHASSDAAIEPGSAAATVASIPETTVATRAAVAATADAPREAVVAPQPAAPMASPAATAPTAAVKSNVGGGRALARSSHPALLFLLVTALVALAVFVLLTLRR